MMTMTLDEQLDAVADDWLRLVKSIATTHEFIEHTQTPDEKWCLISELTTTDGTARRPV